MMQEEGKKYLVEQFFVNPTETGGTNTEGTEFSRFLKTTIIDPHKHGYLEMAVTEDQLLADRSAQLIVYRFTSRLTRFGKTFMDRYPIFPFEEIPEEMHAGYNNYPHYEDSVLRAADGYGLVNAKDPQQRFTHQAFRLNESPYIYTFSSGTGHFANEIPAEVGAENAPAYTKSTEPTDETREHLKREFGWTDEFIDGQAYERNDFAFSHGLKDLHFTQTLLRIPETGGTFERYNIKDQQWVPMNGEHDPEYRLRTKGEKIAYRLRNLRDRIIK